MSSKTTDAAGHNLNLPCHLQYRSQTSPGDWEYKGSDWELCISPMNISRFYFCNTVLALGFLPPSSDVLENSYINLLYYYMDEFFHWTLNSVYILRNMSLIYLQVPSLPPPVNRHWIPIFTQAKIILDEGL